MTELIKFKTYKFFKSVGNAVDRLLGFTVSASNVILLIAWVVFIPLFLYAFVTKLIELIL